MKESNTDLAGMFGKMETTVTAAKEKKSFIEEAKMIIAESEPLVHEINRNSGVMLSSPIPRR